MALKIRKLKSKDIGHFSDLLRIFKEEFLWGKSTVPSPRRLQNLLKNKTFLVFSISSDAQLAGGLTAYVLDSYESLHPSVYLYDIAITHSLQRKGIGTALINHFLAYCKKKGYKEVYVQAENSDLQAVNFYNKTAFSNAIHTTQFTYLLHEC